MSRIVWRLIILFALASIMLRALELSPKIEHRTILPDTLIYTDHTRTLTIDTIQTKLFEPVIAESIGFGYSPDVDVWIKIDLHNPTDRPLQKILEYANPLTSYIELYDAKSQTPLAKDGLLQNSSHRQTLNPYFEITVNPHETKTYYIKASSTITALVIKLDLWKPRAFYGNELHLRSMLYCFLEQCSSSLSITSLSTL